MRADTNFVILLPPNKCTDVNVGKQNLEDNIFVFWSPGVLINYLVFMFRCFCQCFESVIPAVGYPPKKGFNFTVASHSLTRAASRPRLSETEPKWFVFETS